MEPPTPVIQNFPKFFTGTSLTTLAVYLRQYGVDRVVIDMVLSQLGCYLLTMTVHLEVTLLIMCFNFLSALWKCG